ncbi:MAG: hypothetical protein RL710_1525 [Pseudomonadota bacterium]|nr:SPOR domain-containing protein [Rhodoferax sp.]
MTTSPPALPDQTDVTTELYKSVIGPVSQSYYLRVFAHFDAKGKPGILWHWSAFFYTLNWLIFRKMWGLAAWFAGLSLVFTLAVFGIGKLVFGYSETTEGILTGVSVLLAFVLPGLFANAAYYRFCERTINSVLVTGVGVPGACEVLTQRASTRKRLLGLIALNGVALVMLFALLAWVPGGTLVGKIPSMATTVPPEPIEGAEPVQLPALATSAASSAAVAADSASAGASDPAPVQLEPVVTAAAAVPASDAQPSQLADPAANLPSAHSISLPAVPSPVASVPALPVARPVVTAAKSAIPALPAVPVAKPEAVGGAQKPAPAPAPAPLPAPPPAPAPLPAPPPAPAPTHTSAEVSPVPQQYFIQVGAFADLQNARKTMTQLEAMGLDAGAAPVVVKDGRLTRIRVGPFQNRAEARKAADKIKAQGLPALFVKL